MSMTMDSFASSVRRFSPRLLLSELLLKQWFEPVIPFTVMIGLWFYFALTVTDYATVKNSLSLLRLFAEFGFVALAMGFCLISGGIDLSVGAIFAVCNFSALYFLLVLELPVGLVIVATLAVGAALGSINGFLIGYLKTRPFLTTLVTLIILRASVNLLNTSYAQVFATNSVDSDAWDFLGTGSVLGIPINAATLLVVLLVCHIFLSRSRYGWHLTAIGASRKAARHAGIRVRLILFFTYVLSGLLCAASGIFYAARQSSTDSTTGVGWEFQALTAVVLGGISLAGGKGTVWRAMIGAVIIFRNPGYTRSTAYRILALQRTDTGTRVRVHASFRLGIGEVEQVKDSHTLTTLIPHEYVFADSTDGTHSFFTGKQIRTPSGAITTLRAMRAGQPMLLTVDDSRSFKPGDRVEYIDVQPGDRFEVLSAIEVRPGSQPQVRGNATATLSRTP